MIIQKLGQDGAKMEYVQFEAPQTPTTPFVPGCPGAFLHTPVLDTTATFKNKMQRDKQRSKDAKLRLQSDRIHSTPYIQRHPRVLNAVKIGDNIEYLPRPHLVPLPPSPPVPRPPPPGKSFGFFEDYDDEHLYMEEYEESMRPFYPPRIMAPPPPQPSRPSSPGRCYGFPRDDYSDGDSQLGSDDESVIIHDVSSPATDNGSDTSNAIAENVFDDSDEASEDFATEFGRMLEAMLKESSGSESGVSENYNEIEVAVSGAGDLRDGNYSEGEEAMKAEAEQIDDNEIEQEDFDFEKGYFEHEREEEGRFDGEDHYDNEEEYYEDGEQYNEEEEYYDDGEQFEEEEEYYEDDDAYNKELGEHKEEAEETSSDDSEDDDIDKEEEVSMKETANNASASDSDSDSDSKEMESESDKSEESEESESESESESPADLLLCRRLISAGL